MKSIIKLKLFAICIITAFVSTSCSDDEKQDQNTLTPDTITINQQGLYPEGLAYDPQGERFLVSSFTSGAIGMVKDDGTYSNFINDKELISTTGIFIDNARNRVLVTIADPGASTKTTTETQGKLAAIAIYNLSTKQRINYVNLGKLKPLSGHFANDIAVDNIGNAYVTDSFSDIIYKIDLAGTATIFLEDSKFVAPAGSFGLNGIVYHPDGYLIVAKYDEGLLFKIPVNNPSAFTQIKMTQTLSGADGLLLNDNNTLTVSCNNTTNTVFKLTGNNNWNSANVTGTFATGDVFPTTLAKRDGETYVLYAHLGALFSGQTPAVASFKIQKTNFKLF